MTKSDSNVDRLYLALRDKAANFTFKPGERINESVLANELSASRTPIREALNRLVAEGFLTFQSGRGFFCRALTPEMILDLYEARVAIECEAVRLACQRAKDADIAEIAHHLDEIAPMYRPDAAADDLLDMDETYHRMLAGLCGNSELLRMLDNLNDRIRYVRMIDLRGLQRASAGRGDMLAAHRRILAAVALRDADTATQSMRSHIERRREEATEAVRAAYAQLYVPDM